MTVQLAVDLLLVCLLAACLGYGFVLNRRLGVVREDRAAFEALVRQFQTASDEAVRGVEALRTAAAAQAQPLQEATVRAAKLREELDFLVERGARLADRLAAVPLRPAPQAVRPASTPAQPEAETPPPPDPLGARRAEIARSVANLR